jgi:hypothetical protein
MDGMDSMAISKTIAPVGLLALVLLLSGCGGEIGETVQQKEARDKVADGNQSPVTSCDWNTMEDQRLNRVAWVDEADICSTMQSALGRMPSVALARKLSKVVFIFQVAGSKDSAKEISYQMMNIVEVRGQLQNDAAIADSMETITKIFSGSQGHVTPRDINVVLRGQGVNPRTIDEKGIFTLGAMIWEAKKANGE